MNPPSLGHRLLLLTVFSCLTPLAASSLLSAASSSNQKEELRVVIDYPDGKQKSRLTEGGEMFPLGLLMNQRVTITLDFPKKYKGASVVVAPLDGGRIEPQAPLAIPSSGKVSFIFQAGNPGLYRLLVGGAEQYQLQLYVLDPNRAQRASPASAQR